MKINYIMEEKGKYSDSSNKLELTDLSKSDLEKILHSDFSRKNRESNIDSMLKFLSEGKEDEEVPKDTSEGTYVGEESKKPRYPPDTSPGMKA